MTKRTELTAQKCKNAGPPPGGGQKHYSDHVVGGLQLRVSGKSRADCTKVWTGLWRLNGTMQRFPVGTYPAMSLKQAREKASDWKEQVRAGIDPRPEKQPKNKPRIETFADAAQLFIDKKLPTLAPRNARDIRSVIERRLLPEWGTLRLDQFDGTEPADLCDPLVEAGRPGAARAAMEAAKAVMAFAAKRKHIPASPFMGLEPPAKKESRDRVLDDDEISAVWTAAETAGYPAGPLVQLLLLTAARRNEIADAQWSEIDLEKRELVIPAVRTKNKKEHIIPLSPMAVAILEALPRFPHGDYIFTTTGGRRPVSGFTKMRQRIADMAQIEPWTYHDLRRTTATKLAEMNVEVHITEKILNHVAGKLGGVAGIYNRYEYMKERRVALDSWARRLDKIVNQSTAEVVDFPG